jgi:hypothetical protein
MVIPEQEQDREAGGECREVPENPHQAVKGARDLGRHHQQGQRKTEHGVGQVFQPGDLLAPPAKILLRPATGQALAPGG